MRLRETGILRLASTPFNRIAVAQREMPGARTR
jgi:hypothetical protein